MVGGTRPGRRISVLVVDDDAMVQAAIQDYLRIAPDIDVVGVCSSGAKAVEALRRTPADVVLMDVHMPQMDGVAATRAALAAAPDARVIILTSHVDDAIVGGAMAAGASGFLMKSVSPEALVDAVRAVSRGMWIASEVPMRHVRSAAPDRPAQPAPELSERELAVLRHLCAGLGNAEIARTLFMSESSVKGYVTSVLRKLKVTTRLKAVVRAHELGLDEG